MFDQTEIKILNNVYEELRFKRTKDIIDQSHKEKGWIENEKKKDDISLSEVCF
jgi:uncharacterized phage-associated protein